MTRSYLSETDYPAVRRVMGRGREQLSDEALEEMLAGAFPNSSPLEVEDFMSSIQRFARQAAPVVQQVAPAIAQGAMSGATVGGPWGALIGGVGGGAASLIASPPGRAPATRTAPAVPAAAPAPAAAAIGGGGSSAAASAQLLALLSRPETMQALLALLMGAAGRPTIPVGQHRVPVTEFASAISELAAEAASAASAPASPPSRYWLDPRGEPRCDMVDPRARASLLWQDMAEAAALEEEGEWDADENVWPAESSGHVGGALDSFESALAGEWFDDE